MNANERKAWLESLKPGDQVVVYKTKRCLSRRFYRGTVSDITQYLVVVGEWQFRKTDGFQFRKSGQAIMPLTPDWDLSIRHQDLSEWIQELARTHPTLQQLEAMHEAYHREG